MIRSSIFYTLIDNNPLRKNNWEYFCTVLFHNRARSLAYHVVQNRFCLRASQADRRDLSVLAYYISLAINITLNLLFFAG